jgi:hypothetical protein
MRTATDSSDLMAPGEPLVCLLSDRTRGGAVRRVWLRVALAAGAGLASLVVCSGALVAIVWLLLNTTEWTVFGGSACGGPCCGGPQSKSSLMWITSFLLPSSYSRAYKGSVVRT